jgi:hypothetical protein
MQYHAIVALVEVDPRLLSSSMGTAFEGSRQALPDLFCWTRFGTEAGETIHEILLRKEQERLSNQGVFLWGIGNSVAMAVAELVRKVPIPEVLFSPIKSNPRPVDIAPKTVVEWRIAETPDGDRHPIPPTFHVRGGSGNGSIQPRYALVCASEATLRPTDIGLLPFAALRNLLSGKPIGASQVTAVVRRIGYGDGHGSWYPVALRTSLVPPYFVRLRDPVVVSSGSATD